jgi:hypothetical protein
MGNQITTIPRINIKPGIACIIPDKNITYINENDPAIKVMTDFTRVYPVTIEPFVSIGQALRKMHQAGVRLLLVTDADDRIAGIINAYRIQGEKPLQYTLETGIAHDDIRVEMMMIPLDRVPALDFRFVSQSLVRHVIATIEKLESPHALVIETDGATGSQKIRGLFSSTNISRMMGRSVFTPLHAAGSLADIQQELDRG